jgi:hypothetical protein
LGRAIVKERDPNIVTSGLSGEFTEAGVTVKVAIYKLEDRPGWAMEFINDRGTSTVWDGLFDTDDEAYAAFRLTVEEEGMSAFQDQSNVIPFRR